MIGGRPIAARVVNLPHHGSAYDCDASVLTQLFGNSGDRVGISSGNGLTHPDLEVIEWLERNQIWPYCTNLIPACGANIKRLLALNGYDPTLARWMREVADAPGQIQPCQGDVTVQIIDEATAKKHKAICFVTGVPGAGKTLAGLNLVTQRTNVHIEEHAVFLSGNGPLVEVLREALARDEYGRSRNSGRKIRKADAERKVKSFIQNIMHFRDANLGISDPPIERVAVFDEAQRAWDSAHLAKFMAQKRGKADFDQSEPEFLMGIMDRHTDWCTVVCLVGGGQEINSGEAGLTEWFAALERHFRHWKVYVSQQLGHRDYNWDRDLAAMLNGLDVEVRGPLHLSVAVRSFRAEKLSEFVGALIAGEAEIAHNLHGEIRPTYPIALTRSLSTARRWLKARARGTERIGLVASSGAARLKPEGLNVRDKIDPTFWFLNGKDDVRSSYYLEDPATEFDIQGLELDWVGVCWDADFRAVNGQWVHHKFTGTRWQNVKERLRKLYLTNAYRVLLTRARQGIVVYVPSGDTSDVTRQPQFYDGTAEFLSRCGIEPIER